MISNNIFIVYCMVLLIIALCKQAFFGSVFFAGLLIITIIASVKEVELDKEEKKNE